MKKILVFIIELYQKFISPFYQTVADFTQPAPITQKKRL